ncbi:MurR/RpiR family transcriptional regulator [Saccharopolyspora shandongensis]|uniref:MurR/RpiR family transcriptional regulator n=1 Tax=Saccharopolyspora shandongensis TaxID=418495 RepID=UPI0033C0D383
MSGRTPVVELLRQQQGTATAGERKVCRSLLADYPLAGLEPVARLAARAGVSAPTVLRLVGKLGFVGYPEFQQALKDELGERLSSPLDMYAKTAGRGGDHALDRSVEAFTQGIRSSLGAVPAAEVDAAVALLADARRPVTTIGGRFSGILAQYLAGHLRELRPRTSHVPDGGGDRAAALLDMGRRDVVAAFDYRRYEKATIRFGDLAKEQGAALILFTDPWLSPLASSADIVLPVSVQAPSPFDSLVPALALVEAVVAALVDELGDEPRKRLARYDDLAEDVAE